MQDVKEGDSRDLSDVFLQSDSEGGGFSQQQILESLALSTILHSTFSIR